MDRSPSVRRLHPIAQWEQKPPATLARRLRPMRGNRIRRRPRPNLSFFRALLLRYRPPNAISAYCAVERAAVPDFRSASAATVIVRDAAAGTVAVLRAAECAARPATLQLRCHRKKRGRSGGLRGVVPFCLHGSRCTIVASRCGGNVIRGSDRLHRKLGQLPVGVTATSIAEFLFDFLPGKMGGGPDRSPPIVI